MSRLLVSMLGVLVANVACGPILGIDTTVFEPPGPDVCSLVPHRVFFADKPVADTSVTLSIPTAAQFAKIASDLGTTIDPEAGHLLAGITDCNGVLLADAALSVNMLPGASTRFVIDDSGLSTGADTSSPGHLGALNVAVPTELILLAQPELLEGESSSVGEVDSKRGEMSYILLAPNSEAPDPMIDPLPSNLSCVGMVDSPVATAASLTITVDVRSSDSLDPARGQPVAGVRVRFCEDADQGCAIDLTQPIDTAFEALTDATGRALLVVPQNMDGFDGQIVVAGELPNCVRNE